MTLFNFRLCWVFVAVHGLSLAAVSKGYFLLCDVQASHCGGSACGAQALGVWASVGVAHRLSCSMECGIFQYQGSNPCPLHWQADS